MTPAAVPDATTTRPRPRAYVASPLGFTQAGRCWYEARLLPALAAHVEPLDPWALVDPADVRRAAGAGTLRELWLGAGARNAELIAGCDLVVACLDGQEVDSGTASEVGYAAALGRRVYALRTDLRRAGEEGMAVNLQLEWFVVAGGGAIFPTLDALVDRLAADLAGSR